MTCQLFLRTTDANGQSYGGFQWPMEVGATVEAPDWDETPECGGGLHGLLNGEGDGSHLSFADDAIWWIVEADGAVDLSGKHKFRSCAVVAFGSRFEVANEMKRRTNAAVHGCDATVGRRGTATAGYGGTATAGYGGTATAGEMGTATAGRRGTATAGHRGTATAGDWGTATAGEMGTATAGDGGTLVFTKWRNGRRRFLVGYVGEDGIEPNIAYRASDDFTKIIRAE